MAIKRYYLEADRTRKASGGESIEASVSVGSAPPAEGTWSDWVEFDPSKPFNMSVSGTFDADVFLQRSFDGGVTGLDVHSVVDVTQERLVDTVESGVLWRIGVKNGGRTSGTPVCRISQ